MVLDGFVASLYENLTFFVGIYMDFYVLLWTIRHKIRHM